MLNSMQSESGLRQILSADVCFRLLISSIPVVYLHVHHQHLLEIIFGCKNVGVKQPVRQ